MDKIVAPSILSCDFLNIESDLQKFTPRKDLWLHLDIMDGHFVPNLTFGKPIVELISKRFPFILDAHLMVENPEFHMEELKESGVHNFTFHFEAMEDDSLELIQEAKKHFPSVGISLKPGTELEELTDDIYQNIDLLLIMSVEPGFGGQKFIEKTYNKITQAHEIAKRVGNSFMIQIDGGVNDKNASKLYETGAHNLVAGSFIFKEPNKDFESRVSALKN